MTRAIAIVFALLVGCASASAQPLPSAQCHHDHDCVMWTPCCPMDCCACPSALTRGLAERYQQGCTHDDCSAPDCSGRACPACPSVHPACVNGACVAR